MSQIQQFLNKKFPWFQKVWKFCVRDEKCYLLKKQTDHITSFLFL